MYLNVSLACMSVYHVCTVPTEASRKAVNSLQLELQMVVSHQVRARNQIRVLCKILLVEPPFRPHSVLYE